MQNAGGASRAMEMRMRMSVASDRVQVRQEVRHLIAAEPRGQAVRRHVRELQWFRADIPRLLGIFTIGANLQSSAGICGEIR
jgi:hypothetical protein